MNDHDTTRRLFDELRTIREELHALRIDFETKGAADTFHEKINELEIQERLMQIQDEIVDASKPKKKKGLFRRG